MGSLCCIAAKPDRSNSTSVDFSFRPHEPYWRTNTSFSPPSSNWDIHGLIDGISSYGSSTSSTSIVLRSPDLSQAFNWTPTNLESATRGGQSLKQLPGTSRDVGIRSLSSSCSDNGDSEASRNFSGRRFFLAKPVHPVLHPSDNVKDTPSDYTDACSWSSGATSSIDSVDVAEPDTNSTKAQRVDSSTFKCGLCNKYLSQKSPWGSRSIVKNRDMPVTGVLPCQHVFHAECLDQSTSNTHGNDPSCPICTKQGEHFKSLNIHQRIKPLCEDGQSTKPWGCTQASECVQSAAMINRNRLRRNLSHRGNSSKDLPSKIKELQLF